ncbi:MAG TPA: acetylglucosamine transferase, partial [Azospira sp.]|nr:acetylglucosamine transferase [Azospira sp.]
LRIAYLSGDFRQHATAWLTRQLPALHDRSRFEVVLYATGPDDGGELRREMAATADAFHDLYRLDAAATAQRIAMDGIDLLVDLAGYAQYARPAALALRPAPLQVAYLAYLQTTGAPWIDYTLLDRHVLAAGERPWWSERIAYLPDTFYLCDDRLPRAPVAASRAECGLPADAFVFACFNAPWKIDPDTFACWMAILRRVPETVLWLYADSPAAAANLAGAARAAGIDPGRLLFTPTLAHAQHLARYRCADACLDTFGCNAHTTCVEALAAGVPLITLPGTQVVSRVAGSLLAAHGVPELVADSAAAYVDLAVRLATDAVWRHGLRVRLGERGGSRLFCSERRVRAIERAYSMMWERHAAGLPPADFDVPEERA